MNQKNKLIIQMTIFTATLFVIFSLIIINEKSKDFLIPKVNEKLSLYAKEKYKNINQEIKINKTFYDKIDSSFKMKITNKNNKDLYFFLTYKNKKITSSYKKDYLEGNTLLTTLKQKLEKEIKSKEYNHININFNKTLNKYNSYTYDKIITNTNIKSLNIYNINVTVKVKDFSSNSIINKINKFYNYTNKNNFKPKYYNISIINESNITESLTINNLDENLILNNLNEIINGIINNDIDIKTKFNIDYKYSK